MEECEHGGPGIEEACESCIEHVQGRAYETGIKVGTKQENGRVVTIIREKASKWFIKKDEDKARFLRALAEELEINAKR